MARLNGYLYQIGAAVTDECPCGQAKETVEHFLFRCVKWMAQRKEMMLQCVDLDVYVLVEGKTLDEIQKVPLMVDECPTG
jgi:hypothetical protein